MASCNISELSAAVVFYAGGVDMSLVDGPSPLEQAANIHCPMLGLFGEDDANPAPKDVSKMDLELTKHGKTHKFHTYAGAGHGFHCEARESYRPEAAIDAWAKTIAWFDGILKLRLVVRRDQSRKPGCHSVSRAFLSPWNAGLQRHDKLAPMIIRNIVGHLISIHETLLSPSGWPTNLSFTKHTLTNFAARPAGRLSLGA